MPGTGLVAGACREVARSPSDWRTRSPSWDVRDNTLRMERGLWAQAAARQPQGGIGLQPGGPAEGCAPNCKAPDAASRCVPDSSAVPPAGSIDESVAEIVISQCSTQESNTRLLPLPTRSARRSQGRPGSRPTLWGPARCHFPAASARPGAVSGRACRCRSQRWR